MSEHIPIVVKCPDCGKLVATRFPMHKCLHLTKLERFARANHNLSPMEMARQLNRTERAMQRVCASLERKIVASRKEAA